MGHALSAAEWEAGPLSEAACLAPPRRELLVLVVEDAPVLSRTIGFLCDYLGIRVETVPGQADLEGPLRSKLPMAVMSAIDTPAQDGCHVLKTVAEHDRSLPVLLITGNDPALLGAVEAVEEIWQLGQVLKMTGAPGVGDVVEFLFKAGRRSGSSLMPA
jgi:CheY-like chemotaxis protein